MAPAASKVASTTGEEVPQEEKDFVIEFLDGLSECTPLIEAAAGERHLPEQTRTLLPDEKNVALEESM